MKNNEIGIKEKLPELNKLKESNVFDMKNNKPYSYKAIIQNIIWDNSIIQRVLKEKSFIVAIESIKIVRNSTDDEWRDGYLHGLACVFECMIDRSESMLLTEVKNDK